MIHRSHPLAAALGLLAVATSASAQHLESYDPNAPLVQPPPAAVPAAQQPAFGQPVPGAAITPGLAAGGPVQGQVADAAPAPPQPPFVLNDVEQQFVFQTLKMWETESAKINTFNADFERLDYDAVWGPGGETPNVLCKGTLSYSKPDKGSFKIDKISRWTKADPQNPAPDAPGTFVEQKDEVGEHWVCDGKAVYEYNHHEKQLVVTSIPAEMRGTAIVDGPLPFLFGAEAQKLMDRYWIRPKQSDAEQLWLEAFPRRATDAVNYDSVEIILDRKTMQPSALMVVLPGKQQKHVYKFETPTINGKLDAWFGGLFSAPRTPLGWKRVVVDQPPAPAQAANPAAGVQR